MTERDNSQHTASLAAVALHKTPGRVAYEAFDECVGQFDVKMEYVAAAVIAYIRPQIEAEALAAAFADDWCGSAWHNDKAAPAAGETPNLYRQLDDDLDMVKRPYCDEHIHILLHHVKTLRAENERLRKEMEARKIVDSHRGHRMTDLELTKQSPNDAHVLVPESVAYEAIEAARIAHAEHMLKDGGGWSAMARAITAVLDYYKDGSK